MLQIQKRNQNWLPSIFDDLFWNEDEIKARPSMNVTETEKEYRIQFTAPGFTKEETSVSMENDLLVIAMEQKHTEETKGKYLRREFVQRNYRQSFELPDDVDRDKISASLENGLLSISLPKYEHKPQSSAVRQIALS